jgi:hypothetical protein
MPTTPYLDGFSFDAEAKRVMGIAFEMTCVALRVNQERNRRLFRWCGSAAAQGSLLRP